MAKFTYKARGPGGQNVSGTIAGESLEAARDELRKQGLQILDLSVQRGFNMQLSLPDLFRGKGQGSLTRVRVKTQDMIVFTRQLATMLSAGIPLLECLEILAEQVDNLGFRRVIDQVVDDVRTGSDFSESLRRHPRIFTDIYVSMIKAGEASGQLDEILVRLAEYQEAAQALRQRITAAMTYPAVSLALIFAITTGLLVFIIPKFQDIFTGLNIKLPRPTRYLLATSNWMQHNAPVWVGGLIVGAIALNIYKKTPMGRYQVDWVMLRIPVFGPLFRKVAISRFARTFATLIQSGVPILGALEIVAATSGNKILENAILDASASVRQGETLAAPLGKSGVFPPMVTRMIAIGEKSGALESLLTKISEFYDQQVSAAVDGLTSLIEPMLIAVMGVIVGGMVLAIFLPIFKIASSLGGK